MTLHELWDDLVPPERRWLGLLILGSASAHLLFFFIFKIIPPSAAGAPKRPAQVTWVPKNTKGQTSNQLIWLDWRDPSALALPRSPLPKLHPKDTLPVIPDRYQTLNKMSQKMDAPFLIDKQLPLAERVILKDELVDTKPDLVQVETPPNPGGTHISFFGALANRQILVRKEFPQPAVTDVLRVTILNLGVSASGGVETIMVEETSLDASIDLLAIKILRQWRFTPLTTKGTELTWGRAVIYWDFQDKTRSVINP